MVPSSPLSKLSLSTSSLSKGSLGEAIMEFNLLVDDLQKRMVDEYSSVNPDKNPVLINRKSCSIAALEYALGQYPIFAGSVPRLLGGVRKIAGSVGFDKVALELERNIGQEMGSETQGESHYAMLVRGLRLDLSMDVSSCVPSAATKELCAHLEELMINQKDSFSNIGLSLGAAYALECTAVPELLAVREMVREVKYRKTGVRELGSVLSSFFDLHIQVWEPSHTQELLNACRVHVGIYQVANSKDILIHFQRGFHEVLKSMDTWWQDVYDSGKTFQ